MPLLSTMGVRYLANLRKQLADPTLLVEGRMSSFNSCAILCSDGAVEEISMQGT